jgi:hypothetical protein
MSILDGVLGGLVSAGVTAMVSKVLEQHGGVQGLVSQFEKTASVRWCNPGWAPVQTSLFKRASCKQCSVQR